MTQILILDGGLGTSLETDHACTFSSSTTPLWSSHLLLSSPATLLACQRAFARVPVDVLLTATYQVSMAGFAKTKTAAHPDGVAEGDIPRYLDRAVGLAEEAVAESGHGTRVALSLGPYGACMIPSQEYSGIYDDEHNILSQLEAWHRHRLSLFSSAKTISSRISIIALETVPRLDEITAMRRSLASTAELRALPYWVSCLYPGEGDGEKDNESRYLLPDGTTVEAAVRAMLDPDFAPTPWGIGINCTKTWKLEGLLRRYEDAVSRVLGEGKISAWPALVLYPDGTSGEVYNSESQQWELPADSTMEDQTKTWEVRVADAVKGTVGRGKWPQVLVGGCCMASHRDIKKLRDILLPRES